MLGTRLVRCCDIGNHVDAVRVWAPSGKAEGRTGASPHGRGGAACRCGHVHGHGVAGHHGACTGDGVGGLGQIPVSRYRSGMRVLARELFGPGALGFSAHQDHTDMLRGLQRGFDHGVGKVFAGMRRSQADHEVCRRHVVHDLAGAQCAPSFRSPRFTPWRGDSKGAKHVQATVDEGRHGEAPPSANQEPAVPCLFVDGKGEDVQTAGQRPRSHRAVQVQQVVEFSLTQGVQHFPSSSLHGVHHIDS